MLRKEFRNWLLLDYDDTLGGIVLEGEVVPNFRAYLKARKEYEALMLGLGHVEARETFLRIEYAACREHGFSDPYRFQKSLLQSYRELEAKYNRKVDPSIHRELEILGAGVYDYEFALLPNVEDVLKHLRYGYNLAIVTKGNDEIQRKKIQESGAHKYVDAVFVVNHKNERDWQQVISSLNLKPNDLRHTWSVGDSLRSDIKVPLSLGMNSVHVEGEAWEFEDAEIELQPTQKFLTVENITTLKHLF